jgi:diguanylate cyclase (GGDEF)-like protein
VPRLPRLFTWLEERPTAFRTLLAYVVALLLGLLDYLTGYELSFSVFYLLPVCYVAWSVGKKPGILISIFSAAVWLEADLLTGHTYSYRLIPVWNSIVRLSFFLIVSLLVSHLNGVLAREKVSATLDSLTGIANNRRFHAVLNLELDRSMRYQHSFTLAYIDIDNFKAVNDEFGHNAGDFLLSIIALGIKGRIRSTDTVARLGGDEFAILFPETGFETSQALLQNLQTHLLEAMHRNQLTVTFSIGAVTFDQSPASADEVINASDAAMYRAKKGGKNRINLEKFPKTLRVFR